MGVVNPQHLAFESTSVDGTHERRRQRALVLPVDGHPVNSEKVPLGGVHKVMTIEVTEREVGMIIDVNLVARQDAGEPEIAGFTLPVAEEHTADALGGVQLPACCLATRDPDASSLDVPLERCVELDPHRGIPHVVHRGEERRHPTNLIELGTVELRIFHEVLGEERAGDGRPNIDQIAFDQPGLVEAHVAGLGPERLPVLGVLPLDPVGHRGP